MKSRHIYFVLLVLCLLSAGVMPAAAQDIIEPPPPVWGPESVKIDYHRVNVAIENQIATTQVDMQFTNEGGGLAEGVFIFPLPEEAAVDQLVMFIDGVPIEARILPADEARGIYNEIVRQLRDPALLEYIGTSAIQANVFPIPAGESRRIQITYGQVLAVDNGLFHYIYPLHSALNTRAVEQMSIGVQVIGDDPISNIYSPSHNIAISRMPDTPNEFRAGFETTNFVAGEDFSLFYGVDTDTININLLSFRESANEDGYFMLLMQPPISLPEDQIIPKDVIVVLDQSGSMDGTKWEQALKATTYILENLNPRDRFNLVVFSTGVRVYGNDMQSVDEAPEAVEWVNNMFAEGGTDINLALTTATEMAEEDRQTTIIFMTDGLATEGVIQTDDILTNIRDTAGDKTRIFTFGVGDDVDTFLLDQLFQEFGGTGSYVRPTERIDEEVASLYNKISSPVLTDTELDFGGARVELIYPATLPDLFAGEQLALVGRYRDGIDDLSLSLSGEVNGQVTSFVYDGLELRDNAGGESFIARLWATRRIGDLLNTIRLNGETDELVDSVVNLSVRYGIITPYTSFLIEEDDILTQQGRDRARTEFEEEAAELNRNVTGGAAVDAADDINSMNQAAAPMDPAAAMPTQTATMGEDDMDANDGTIDGYVSAGNAINNINSKTFVNINGVWNDTSFDPDNMTTNMVEFLSDEYFELLEEHPELNDYFSLGDNVIVVIEGVAWQVVPEA